ncbi:MAG: FAD-dependent oxidoreductase [Burkholderiales bacterium]|nr:FAD-dependent oxidoreductase [Burkholderiales bacterium]
MRRIAVIGSGISGLAAAHALAPQARVTLFEAGSHFGGHSHTVDVRLEGIVHGVDTGFLVFNHRTYPQLVALFKRLGVETAPSDMSFSVQVPQQRLEWSGSDLNAVFAQRRNLLRPRFLGMLAQILRFNKLCTGIALAGEEAAMAEPIEDFLDRHGFGSAFRDWYLLPMLGCIWSCPTDQMLRFPVGTMIRFCHNHGLIQVNDRPQWHTVVGGSRQYVRKMLQAIPDARLRTPVRAVRRSAAGATVATDAGSEHYDEVVLACHSDQALALLADASQAERQLLGAIRYQPNRAVLHTDTALLPQRQLAWAAWNYERAPQDAQEQSRVCLHYLINKLQPLPWRTPVVVSLNPVRRIAPDRVIGEFGYSHPVFDSAAVAAQRRLAEIQGVAHTWFCGAWTRYGFHEDGLMSGNAVAAALGERLAAEPAVERAAA